MEYTVENGIIKSNKGIPCLPRWFAEERLVFEIDKYGIANVEYWNRNTKGSEKIFCANLWGGMRFFLEEDGRNYAQHIEECSLLPFGFKGEWLWKDMSFSYMQISINDCILIAIKPKNPPKYDIRFKMEFYNRFCFSPIHGADERYDNPVKRQWRGWKREENFFTNVYKEDGGKTAIAISGNFDIEISESIQNKKYTLKTQFLNQDEFVFIISFDESVDKAKNRCRITLENYKKMLAEISERYLKISENAPKLESRYEYLNNFIALEPMYAESLKIKEYPGAVRAKTTYYWVWGWDGMTSNFSTAYKGDINLLENLLDLYMIYSDDEKGIVHAYSKNMEIGSISALPAQGMYITLLYLYFVNGGTINKYYQFAKKIFNMICEKEIADLGFCEGTSLFPDFPADMLENGHDISGFNNTVFYAAGRSMEALADYMNDTEMVEKSYSVCEKIQQNFKKIFYDSEKGFIVSSVDSKTLEKRNIFNSNSIKWENAFVGDLVSDFDEEALGFFEENIVTDMGLREIPSWCEAYDKDANQLHCWWPVTGEYFSRLINKFDRTDLIEKWIKWVSLWTKRLMCPEGISCYIETEEPDFDFWNCQCGSWQAYSARAWYEAAIHSVVGVDGDFGGLTFYPYSCDEINILNLHWGGNTYDIFITGKGSFIEEIIVNGKVITGTNKLPSDVIDKHNTIQVKKCAEDSCDVRIISGTGLGIREYKYEKNMITADIYGYGHCRLNAKGTMFIDGIKTDGWIDFTENKTYKLTLKI